MRSSQRGNHQAFSPSSVISAGMMVMRTRKASSSTPIARPKPMGRIIAMWEKMKPANTEVMMIAAAVTTARPPTMPRTTAVRAG